MRIQFILLIFCLFVVVSCKTPHKDYSEMESRKSSTEQELKPIQSHPIDTNILFKVVADDILIRLLGQQIRKSDFDENGDFYIEFNEDATDADPDEIIWEYYRIEKDGLVTGKLNSDDRIDFAFKSIWGPIMGNMFGLEWHIYISENDKYKRIKNDFGGGKFSDMESVTAIDMMKLKTEFQEFDEETALLKDSVEFREYELIDNELKRIR